MPEPLEEATGRLRRAATTGLAKAVAARSISAVARFLDRASGEELGRVAAASSDYMVLAEELSCPEALDVMQRDEPLAAARIRGFKMMEHLLRAEGGCLNVEAVARQLRMSRQGVDRRRKTGRLLAIELGRRGYAYPAWQFTERGLLPGLEEVLAQLTKQAIPAWDVLAFFLNRSHLLDDSSPLSELRKGNIEGVLRAAAACGEQGAA
jgi:hypothetical protein